MTAARSRSLAAFLSLAVIVMLAIVLRVAAMQVIGEARVPWNYEYEDIAHNLITDGQYAYNFYNLTPVRPTSFIPPVYPLVLASGRGWFGGDAVLQGGQIALSGLTVLLVYALARELGAPRWQGTLAALFMAVYPPAATYAAEIGTVTLETVFVTGGVWLVLRAAKRGSPLYGAGAGILLSLAALTRPTWLVLLPLAVLWLIWYLWRRGLSVLAKPVAALFLASAILFTPWVWHYHVTQGGWSVTSTNGGLNFWIGNNPKATGEYVFPMDIDNQLVRSVASLPEAARDAFFYQRGLDFIRSSPGQSMELLGRKLLYFLFFRPNIGSNYQQSGLQVGLAAWFFVLPWLALIPLALVGLANLGREWRKHFWLILIFVSQIATSAIYFVGTRFRTPIDSFVMIWAVMGLFVIVSKWQSARSRSRAQGSVTQPR